MILCNNRGVMLLLVMIYLWTGNQLEEKKKDNI